MVLDGDRLLAIRHGVSKQKVPEVLEEFRRAHGPGSRLLIDGRELPESALVAPPKAKGAAPRAPRPPEPTTLAEPKSEEHRGVELAHHLLWESYQRAAQTQAFMLEKMTGTALDMNRRFCDQVAELQDRYQAAMAKLDHMAFEQKMMEHEAAGRRLGTHFRRMQAEERRADESPLDWVEGAARGIARVLDIIGGDTIDDNTN